MDLTFFCFFSDFGCVSGGDCEFRKNWSGRRRSSTTGQKSTGKRLEESLWRASTGFNTMQRMQRAESSDLSNGRRWSVVRGGEKFVHGDEGQDGEYARACKCEHGRDFSPNLGILAGNFFLKKKKIPAK